MVRCDAETTCSLPSARTETVVSITSAVVKVHYKAEVLRFRVAWPLDLGKLRSDVFLTLQRPGPTGRTIEENGEVCASASSPPPILLYHGSNGKLLELCDTNAQDFLQRHDPAKPIRLHVLTRSPESRQPLLAPVVAKSAKVVEPERCVEAPQACPSSLPCDAPGETISETGNSRVEAGEKPLQHSRSASAEFVVIEPEASDEATTSGAVEATATELTHSADSDARSPVQETDSTCVNKSKAASVRPPSPCLDAAVPPLPYSPLEVESPQPYETVQDFLGGYRGECLPPASRASSRQSPEKGTMKSGISLPVAAQTAAFAISDVLVSARDRLNEALSLQDRPNSVRHSPKASELQRTLRESAELQEAIEISAAQSRVRLNKVLDLYQLRLRPVAADGNCQFRALSVQLYGDESQHAAIRQLVIKQMLQSRDRYEGYMLGSYEEYVTRMALDGEWGDNVTLQAVSDIFNCQIHVLTDQPGSELLELNPEAQPELGAAAARPKQQALCLAFLTEVHYDAVVVETP